MNNKQLHDAIYNILLSLKLYSNDSIIKMIFETACVESNCGEYIKQINGPACGIFQIEPNTAQDIIDNYIKYRSRYKDIFDMLYIKTFTLPQNLKYNLAFSVFMCRMFYMRIKESIPNTVEKRAEYWKKYYNTEQGKGTTTEYIRKVGKYGKF